MNVKFWRRPPPVYPANQELFQMRLEFMRRCVVQGHPMMKMPVMVKDQCVLVLCAYHGSRARMIRFLILDWYRHWRIAAYHRAIMWVSDRLGWTRLYHIPATDTHCEHWERHGRQCSGSPNCQDILCHIRSMPKWFRWVTGHEKIYK